MSTAWIFDFDGVLVSTMGEHFACYSQALAEAGMQA
jgi:beta-phosphoglucomutase-like phosphatase (HAD superfamily)